VAGGGQVIIIKKKAKGHAHHGGAWKVAYADFVTAMMALFIVLWILSQTDEKTKQKLSEYFRTGVFSGAPSVLMGGTGLEDKGYIEGVNDALNVENRAMDVASKRIKEALARAVASNPDLKAIQQFVDVKVTDQGLLIQIIDGGKDMLFDLSSAELKPTLVQLLKTIAPILGSMGNQLQVHGHTDSRPFPRGSVRDNWGLSFERADAARRVLNESGVRPGQIVGVFAHADSSPYVPDDPKADANRRLAILAVMRGLEDVTARGQPVEQLMQKPARGGNGP